jgi:hypothetical protein
MDFAMSHRQLYYYLVSPVVPPSDYRAAAVLADFDLSKRNRPHAVSRHRIAVYRLPYWQLVLSPGSGLLWLQ